MIASTQNTASNQKNTTWNWIVEKGTALIDGKPLNALARQLIRTGGNVSESAFIIATLWVICNAVAHTVLSWFIPDSMITLFNSFAAIAFTILPELIAVATTSQAIDLWRVAYQQNDKLAKMWALFYTVLALIFITMTIITIGTFVSTDGNTFVPLTGWQLCIRALSGWTFAFINMLYKDYGKGHVTSHIVNLKTDIDGLNSRIDQLQKDFALKMEAKETEIEKLHTDYHRQLDQKQSEVEQFQTMVKSQFDQLQLEREKARQARLQDLSSYPLVVTELIEEGKKTVSFEELTRLTGHSKQRLAKAKLRRHSVNKDLVMVPSLIEWLKTAPLPSGYDNSQSEYSNGHGYQDTEALSLPYFAVVGDN